MYDKRGEHEVLLPERRLIVFPPKQLWSDSDAMEEGSSCVERLTMICEASDVPPRFAMTGAVRCMRAKVVMNGADPWAMRVNAG